MNLAELTTPFQDPVAGEPYVMCSSHTAICQTIHEMHASHFCICVITRPTHGM
jgi:hypothetical protein